MTTRKLVNYKINQLVIRKIKIFKKEKISAIHNTNHSPNTYFQVIINDENNQETLNNPLNFKIHKHVTIQDYKSKLTRIFFINISYGLFHSYTLLGDPKINQVLFDTLDIFQQSLKHDIDRAIFINAKNNLDNNVKLAKTQSKKINGVDYSQQTVLDNINTVKELYGFIKNPLKNEHKHFLKQSTLVDNRTLVSNHTKIDTIDLATFEGFHLLSNDYQYFNLT